MKGTWPMLRGNRTLRLTSRWLVLAAAVALAWPWRQDSSTSVLLPALSPFIAVAASISLKAVSMLALLALPVLLLVGVVPRWFCRYGCPVGLLQEYVGRLRPGGPRRGRNWPAVGQWLVLLTIGGALLGYPFFLWLDPLALFNGFLNAWRQPVALITLLTGLGLPLLLLLDLVAPGLWCRRLCPLGATQDFLARFRRLFPGRSRCPGPDQKAGGRRVNQGRRWFLGGLLTAGGVVAARVVRAQGRPVLRPPGSLDEQSFPGVCVRCGNCAQVCPSGIIQPDLGASGVTGFLSPRLRFDEDYCREGCHLCGRVCPSGAIARLSLADKRRHVIGRAVVDLDCCLLVQGRECTACIQKCPYQAIAMRSADGGFSMEPGVIADRCNGCGACEAVCPTGSPRAIQVQSEFMFRRLV